MPSGTPEARRIAELELENGRLRDQLGKAPQKVFHVRDTPFNALGSSSHDDLKDQIRKAEDRGEKVVVTRRMSDWSIDTSKLFGRPCKEDV